MSVSSIPRVARSTFGLLPDGTEVERVALHAADGLEARIITYGASLQALLVPVAAGRATTSCWVMRRSRVYSLGGSFFGATIGRLCQPHCRARALCSTAPRCNLRQITGQCTAGGLEGFDRRNWRIVATEDGDSSGRDACVHECRWRGGLSGYADASDLAPDRADGTVARHDGANLIAPP